MINYIETGSFDPCYNLAFEEYLLKNKTEGSWLMLWQNANTVVIGLNQNAAQEINAAFVKEHNITVVRRTTGGGAVYHDMGNLNYSFITDLEGEAESLDIKQFCTPVCRALAAMGIAAEVSGRNDITVEGKKISGTAQRVYKNRVLHHGTLLFSSDPYMISGALNADPEKFKSKSSKSVRSRVGNIKDYLKSDMTVEDFKTEIFNQLSLDGAAVCKLTDEELKIVNHEADEKYRSWEWTFGKCPKYSCRNRARYEGGTIEVSMYIEKGIIKELSFGGDFMAVTDNSNAANSLKGVKLEKTAILEALSHTDIPSQFGGIKAEEIAETMLMEKTDEE